MTASFRSCILSCMTVNDYVRDFVAGLLPASLFSCGHINVPEYELGEAGEGELRIAHVSDLHSNDFGGKDGLLAHAIREARPDLIVMTGDIFDIDMGVSKTFSNVRDFMAGIAGLCPIYYVIGNHEFYADEKPFLSAIASYGAVVLTDESVQVSVAGRPLVIAGLADPLLDLTREQRIEKKKDAKEAYLKRLSALARKAGEQKASCGCPSILLAHRPEYLEDYAGCGFDLVFSGHAHGGQWIVPGLVNGLYAVGQGFFPKYAGGLYTLGGTSFIVSRGLSYQRPAFPRFGNPPELPLVRLRY
ncbi:MAG: metallophosphoesterase [Treponema sp.]|nr:metallophosphoesterase [Treponema sp.]